MERMTVKEFKTHFFEALKRVMLGEEIAIYEGDKNNIIAFLVPKKSKKKVKRKIGLLDKKAGINFNKSFKITTEEFLGL